MADDKLLSQLGPDHFVALLHEVARHVRGRLQIAFGTLPRKQLLEVCSALHRDVQLAVLVLSADPEDDGADTGSQLVRGPVLETIGIRHHN